MAATVARYGYQVGFIDTDIQSLGIHVVFGFDQETMERSLNDYLWGRCDIEDTAYDVTSALKNAAKKESAIYLIPSSLNLGEITKVLREGYDVRLLDKVSCLVVTFLITGIIDFLPVKAESLLLGRLYDDW